jgi:hypothetical protein
MPNISLTLPGISQSVTRPVIFDIINQLNEITKTNKDTKIFFPGDIAKMRTPGTSIDDQTERFAVFNTNYITFIEVEEDYDHDTLGSTAVSRKEHIPTFIDRRLGMYVTPVYATSNVVINFKYRCPNKTEALRWRDDIRMRVSQLRDVSLHNLTYHYLLSPEVLDIIQEVYIRREAVASYNETLEEYILSHSTDRLTVIGDLVAKSPKLAISETQCRIVGTYGWDAIPDKPDREDSGVFTISFSYKFSYEKPIACNFRYPVMVHNQLMPKQYTYFSDKAYDLYRLDKSFTLSLGALNKFETDTVMDNAIQPDALIRLPSFDDFKIQIVPPGTGTVFIALSEVDIDNKMDLLNLNDLGNLIMDPDILEFIVQSEYPYICNLYSSIINLSLYRNEYLTSSKSIKMNQACNVSAVLSLDLRNQHRVRFSLITDLSLLNAAALERLKKFPKAFIKIIGAINELLRNHPDFVNLGSKSCITINDFSPIYAILTGQYYDNGKSGSSDGKYYGDGLGVSGFPAFNNKDRAVNGGVSFTKDKKNNGSKVYADIPLRVIESYRRNRISTNTVSVVGIIAFRRD